jgi:hypothetical protein
MALPVIDLGIDYDTQQGTFLPLSQIIITTIFICLSARIQRLHI